MVLPLGFSKIQMSDEDPRNHTKPVVCYGAAARGSCRMVVYAIPAGNAKVASPTRGVQRRIDMQREASGRPHTHISRHKGGQDLT